jgi:Cdc6-like AAA superfamily ATPase
MAKKAEDPNQKQSFPRELLDQSPAARLAYFKSYTVAHPFLQRANKEIWDALQEPGGALMIFIVGPTGVGKTTLWEHIDQRLTEAAQARMLQDPDHMPVINLYAMAPSSRQFRWPDFYTRALMAVSEPLIDYKVDSGAIIPIYNEKMRRHVPPQLVGDAAMLQRSWEQVLRYRKPDAIFVDEAQHLAKTAGGSRLIYIG